MNQSLKFCFILKKNGSNMVHIIFDGINEWDEQIQS